MGLLSLGLGRFTDWDQEPFGGFPENMEVFSTADCAGIDAVESDGAADAATAAKCGTGVPAPTKVTDAATA